MLLWLTLPFYDFCSFFYIYVCRLYPRGSSDARIIAIMVCLSVFVCDTRRYCIKTAKRRITQTTPRDSPVTLVSDAKNRWWMTPTSS